MGPRTRSAAGLLASVLLAASCAAGDPDPSPTTTTSTAPAPTTTTTTPCVDGSRTRVLEGVRVREFCGPARVRVTVGPSTLDFNGGTCERHEDWFALNMGIEVVEPSSAAGGPPPAAFRSFTILMGRHPLAAEDAVPVSADGVYTTGVLTFTDPPTTFAVNDKTVTLLATRTAATFAGIAAVDATPDQSFEVRGSFTCDQESVPLDRVPELEEAERGGE